MHKKPRDARALLEFASNEAERFLTRMRKVPQLWFAIREDGEQFVIPAPHGARNMDEIVAMVTAAFELQRVVRYAHVAEADITDLTGRSEEEIEAFRRNKLQLPSTEAVMISVEDASQFITATRKIIRPAHGKPRLGPLIVDEPVSVEGRLASLLAHLRPAKMS